ncbi:MAG: hypothetical protein NZ927_07330 [Candidatus Calescibacterium sp.]|nr:hypothetical protein [Candidatus Calescibacterium sp.]MDW8087335.1 hypothetical protein [Candidatus Calescibacterium sp.]
MNIRFIFVVLSFAFILTIYAEEKLPISKKIIPVIDFVRRALEDYSGVELEQARYFSRNSEIHPTISILLKDPIYSPIFFTKIQDALFDRRSTSIFFTISRLSAEIKRIDLLQDPSQKYFEPPPDMKNINFYQETITYPDTISAIYSLALCINESVNNLKSFIERNKKFSAEPPKELTHISEIVLRRRINQKEIESFLENLNTSFYIVLHCVNRMIASKSVLYQIKNTTKLEALGVNIEIHSGSDDFVVISDIPTIIVNLGGNDSYLFIRWDTTQKKENITPSSLIILDFGEGNDRYSFYDPQSLSLNLIYDEGGNDEYNCNIACFGGAIFSADMLIDLKGNDTYKALGVSQGAGIVGTGVLIDLEGNDVYQSIAFSQGFGGLGGGILVDYQGNDKYILKKGKEFPSFQDREHNLSMGQGCGTGIRADYIAGFQSIPGGVGILFDFSGNDSYSAEVFSQGCGYWYGAGVLGDIEGNDVYQGYWYCQGSSAHFGAGVFYDLSGNDSYLCNFQAQGHGHDFGIGVFLDHDSSEDSDSFLCDTRCLGSAHANGVSVFINQGGSDSYKANRIAFGDSLVDLYERKEHSVRQIMPTKGFFLDIGGQNDKFFIGEKQITKDEVKSNWYSGDQMKKYIEENYTIRKFYKF